MAGFTVRIQNTPQMWLAVWNGDPGRTFCIENARVYATRKGARIALAHARTYRELNEATIEEVCGSDKVQGSTDCNNQQNSDFVKG